MSRGVFHLFIFDHGLDGGCVGHQQQHGHGEGQQLMSMLQSRLPVALTSEDIDDVFTRAVQLMVPVAPSRAPVTMVDYMRFKEALTMVAAKRARPTPLQQLPPVRHGTPRHVMARYWNT